MREYHILNLGVGVQSSALFLLAREPEAKLRFDLAIFADTGEEPAAVSAHLEYHPYSRLVLFLNSLR